MSAWDLRSIDTYYYSGTSSTYDLGSEEDLIVYPNPTRDHVTVQMQNATPIQSITIMDVTGKRTLQETNSTDGIIKASEWTSGWYLYQIISDDKLYTGKFLKL